MAIIVKPCMAVDAICYLERGLLNTIANMPKAQVDVIHELNQINYHAFEKSKSLCSTSALSDLISIYFKRVDLSVLTLKDIITFFNNLPQVKADILASYSDKYSSHSYLDAINNLIVGEKEIWLHNLQFLIDNDFEKYRQINILPLVLENINLKESFIKKNNLHQILDNIKILRNQEIDIDLYIYVSYLTTPLCFQVDSGYVDNVSGVHLTSLIAHEKMHGFASSELITLYQQYVNKNSFLKENHRRLLEEWGSGDEEELVMSAEYYLLYLHGWPKNKIIARAKNNYDGCCLLALVLFDLATQEVKIIKDYNKWCINKFTLGLVPVIDDDYIKTKYALKINPDYFGKWYSSELNERFIFIAVDNGITVRFSFGNHEKTYEWNNLFLDDDKLCLEMNDEYYARLYQFTLNNDKLFVTIIQLGKTIESQFMREIDSEL